jgi:hypothetical protein
MRKLNAILLKTVWWTGWPLLPVLLAFLATGYAISGRYGFGRLLEEKTALTLHKLLHGPLLVLVLVHSVPAIYLALQRWGWTRKP